MPAKITPGICPHSKVALTVWIWHLGGGFNGLHVEYKKKGEGTFQTAQSTIDCAAPEQTDSTPDVSEDVSGPNQPVQKTKSETNFSEDI